MSIIQALPSDSRPFKTDSEFTATFNNPTVNRYDFDIAANKNIFALNLQPACLYFLERVNFSADITEQAFHRGQLGVANRIKISVKYSSNGQAIYPTPIPFVNYLDNFEIHQFAGNDGIDGESIVLDCVGQLKQVQEMQQAATITVYASWSIYQIKNNEWVRAYANGNLWRLTSGIDKASSERISLG